MYREIQKKKKIGKIGEKKKLGEKRYDKFKRNEKIILQKSALTRKQCTEKTLSNCVNFIVRISRTKPLNREAYARPLLLPALSTDCFSISHGYITDYVTQSHTCASTGVIPKMRHIFASTNRIPGRNRRIVENSFSIGIIIRID